MCHFFCIILCPIFHSLPHIDTLWLLVEHFISKSLLFKYFWTQQKSELKELRKKGGCIPPDVTICQQAGGMKCTPTISITITLIIYKVLHLFENTERGFGSRCSLPDRDTWEKRKYNTWLHSLLEMLGIWQEDPVCVTFSLFGWTSVQFCSRNPSQ